MRTLMVAVALAAWAAGAEEVPAAVEPAGAAPEHDREKDGPKGEFGRTPLGGPGLWRTRSAFFAPKALAMSAHAGFFRVPALTNTAGVDEFRMTTVGATFAFFEGVEMSMALRSATLEQTATAAGTYFLVNDFFLRFKGGYHFFNHQLAAAIDFSLRVPPPVFRANPVWLGLSPSLGGVLSYDFSSLGAPILFHVNTGFTLDNSADFDDGTGDASRRFALGVYTWNQWYVQGGLEGRFHVQSVGIRPFVEYSAEFALGANGPQPMRVTPGLKVLPWRGVVLEGGVELGLTRPTANGVPPVPGWMMVLSVGYQGSVEPAKGGQVIVEKVVTTQKTVTTQAPPTTGKLRGAVIDESAGTPLREAVVAIPGRNKLLTDDKGAFTVEGLKPGPVDVSASQKGYGDATATGLVTAGGTLDVVMKLKALPPEPPPPATIKGTVLSEKEAPLVATVAAPDKGVATKAGNNGEFTLELPSGEVTLEVTAPGHQPMGKRIVVRPGDSVITDFVLKETPKQTLVVLKKEKIEIKKPVHFATGKDVILPDSAPLLDQIAGTLLSNHQLRKLRIEGHTDDQGDDAFNLLLSQKRAEAVVRQLLDRGVSPSRVKAVGFGEAKPIDSNKTLLGRAKNRRVEFMIEEQD